MTTRVHPFYTRTINDKPGAGNFKINLKISHFTAVPAYLAMLVEYASDRGLKFPDVRILTSSGEPLMSDLATNLVKVFPCAKILNIYGSSEVSADVTCYECKPEHLMSGAVPVGKPISNTKICIVNNEGNIMPAMVVGRVHVEGAPLSIGYSDKELFEQDFIKPKCINGLKEGYR